jgi:hypothetical protein
MANGVKTGGRAKGTPNKATVARKAELAASGLSPVEFMLAAMRDESKDFAIRLEAARAVAPYVHPRLAQVAHTGDGSPLVVKVVRFTDAPAVDDMPTARMPRSAA